MPVWAGKPPTALVKSAPNSPGGERPLLNFPTDEPADDARLFCLLAARASGDDFQGLRNRGMNLNGKHRGFPAIPQGEFCVFIA